MLRLVELDVDDDGMVDSFEEGDLDPSGDEDMDGFSNLREFWAGTNPIASSSFYDEQAEGWSIRRLFPKYGNAQYWNDFPRFFRAASMIADDWVFVRDRTYNNSGYYGSVVYAFQKTNEGWSQKKTFRRRVSSYNDSGLGRGMVSAELFVSSA